VPPLLMTVPMAMPPEETTSCPPLSIVPLAVPPERIPSKPLLSTITPPLDWPAEMSSV
jgi:hypothetical protein